jgi:hypothetical protein
MLVSLPPAYGCNCGRPTVGVCPSKCNVHLYESLRRNKTQILVIRELALLQAWN